MSGLKPVILLWFVVVGLASCTFTQKVKTGEQAYEFKQYHLATQLLESEYDLASLERDKARKAYLLGKSFEAMNEPVAAARWYERAYRNNYGIDALRLYAGQLRQAEQYAQAIEIYGQLVSSREGTQQDRRMLTVCQQALEWKEKEDENPYSVVPIQLNTPASEFAPYVTGPGQLIISSDMPQSTGDDTYAWTGRFFSDLYLVDLSRNTVERFDPEINSKHNEGTLYMSGSGDEIFFVRCFSGSEYDSFCKIMVSRKAGLGWSKPEVVSFCRPGINYGSPFLGAGDSSMYFSANDPDGTGGYDIYRVRRQKNDWGQPELLSGRVNTQGNEKFPTLDGDTLYFASDALVGMGGLDIYKTYPLQDGDWAPPENLKAPVNSGADDFYFYVDNYSQTDPGITQSGYFTSSRMGGQGSDDIYAFERRPVEPEVLAENKEDSGESVKPVKYQIFIAIKVSEPIFENPDDPNSARVGRKPLANARVSMAEGEKEKLFRTDEGGLIVFELDFDKEYYFRASYPDHLTQFRAYNTMNIPRDPENPVTTYNMDIVLDPIFKGKEIVLENIYYDFDQWFIRADARPTLDSLSQILNSNPDIRIQLSSHTDCRGDEDYNEELSQKRAQSAVEYLIETGVDASRLVAKGYGESQLLVDCICAECSEEQHQQNRRTTFKVID